jgi:hypothetical protein
MPQTLKAWQGWIVTPRGVEARHRDGRLAQQVVAAVRATSQKAAAKALDVPISHLRNYMAVTGNVECLAALDQYPPGTVLLHPDYGGTVLGQTDWVPLPKGS